MACGILVPRLGIEPVPPAVEARSPNHWTAREFPPFLFMFFLLELFSMNKTKATSGDFPGGSVLKNPPANAGDTGSSPGPGRSHMPRSN